MSFTYLIGDNAQLPPWIGPLDQVVKMSSADLAAAKANGIPYEVVVGADDVPSFIRKFINDRLSTARSPRTACDFKEPWIDELWQQILIEHPGWRSRCANSPAEGQTQY